MAEQMGEYNRLVEIWKPNGLKDSAGEMLVGDAGFSFYKKKWAKVRGRNGMGYIREIGANGGKNVQAPLDLQSVRVAWCEDIDANMQVRYRGHAYAIVQVRVDDADREYTDIIVRLGGSDGSQ